MLVTWLPKIAPNQADGLTPAYSALTDGIARGSREDDFRGGAFGP